MANGYTRQSSGQIVTGQTIEASHHNNEFNALQDAFAANTGHNHDGSAGNGGQLTPGSLFGISADGIIVRQNANTFVARELVAPAAGITITNPKGTAGNITIVLADDLAGIEGLSGTGLATRTAANTWVTRTLTSASAGLVVTAGDGVSGNPTLTLGGDLNALEAQTGTGYVVRTADDTYARRTISTSGDGLATTNSDGVSGNTTIALANDLAAIEALSGTGIAVRTAANTWDTRNVVSSSGKIGITNPAGVAGNIDLTIANGGVELANLATALQAFLLPSGFIGMWSGTIANIPTGWVLCNGSNSTPDLRDKFIVGATQDDAGVAKTNITGALTTTGGTTTHNHGGATGSTALTIAQMPDHSHTVSSVGNVGAVGAGFQVAVGDVVDRYRTLTTSSQGSGAGHTHTIASVSHVNPYYALAFIMKT